MPSANMNDEIQLPDRVRLPLDFDAERLAAEVASMQLAGFIYYNVIPLRAPAHLVDRQRPEPPPASDFADGTWTEWLDTPQLAQAAYLREVVDTFRAHTTVNLVRLLRLEAGAVVREHTDPTLGMHIERSMVRLTIPIVSPPEAVFYLNGTPVDMRPGSCWYLRLSDPHRVENGSAEERVNLTIDVIPNAWVRALVGSAVD